jgi:hypothetical protein
VDNCPFLSFSDSGLKRPAELIGTFFVHVVSGSLLKKSSGMSNLRQMRYCEGYSSVEILSLINEISL